MFVNKKIAGIYYSMFIASWVNSGGNFNKRAHIDDDGEIIDIYTPFEEWLKSIEFEDETKINEVVAREIYEFATCGKFELEADAARYLQSIKPKKK